MASSTKWGEMNVPLAQSSASSVVDMEALAMKSRNVPVKMPHLHQPSAQQKPNVQPLQSELCRPDSTCLHTINLMKHCRQIRSRILSFQHQQDSSKSDFISHRQPPLPAMPQLNTPEGSSTIKVITGIKERPGCPKLKLRDGGIEIDSNGARQLSRRAVATVCAHSGYDASQESSLETLTDVLQEFLMNTCKLLRVAVDREAHTGQTGFQDTLTQVLHEIGVGSRHTLFDFWKTRIKDHHDRILKQTQDMRDKYHNMKNPSYQMQAQEDKSPRVKEEPLSDASFQDPQSNPHDDAAENQSETSSSETQSSQPLAFQGLGTIELDDSNSQPATVPGDSVDENSASEWYAGVKEEVEAGDEVTGGSVGGVKRELMSSDEASQDMKTEEVTIDDSSLLSSGNILDVDTTSPVEKKIQLNMPPKKKKKK